MITFNTQEEFDSAVMAAVEKYLQIGVAVKVNRNESYYEGPYTKVDVRLVNILSQTTFTDDGDSN